MKNNNQDVKDNKNVQPLDLQVLPCMEMFFMKSPDFVPFELEAWECVLVLSNPWCQSNFEFINGIRDFLPNKPSPLYYQQCSSIIPFY